MKNIDFLATLIDKLPAYLFWKDTQGTYLGCNQNFANHLGVNSPKDVVGKTDLELPISKESSKSFQKIDQNIMESQQEQLNIEESQLTLTGEVRYLVTSKVPLTDEEGRCIGLLGIYSDITEKKLAENALKKAKEAAEQANEAKTNFLMNMSHDLRTPFSGILGMSQLLLDQETDPHKKAMLNDVVASSKQLLSLLNDILSHTRSETRGVEVKVETVDLRKIIDDIQQLFQAELCRKNIQFSIDVLDHTPRIINSDNTLLYRILLNLVNNAVKFTHEGSICIKLDYSKEHIHIDVIDTGIGIASDKIDTIFDPFTRLAASHQGVYQGAGIGLSLVKQLVNALDGTITVSSELGKGSCFTLRLPCQHLEMDQATQHSKHPGIGPLLETLETPSPRVLIVEDDPISQRFAQFFLESHHCIVTLCDNGLLAREKQPQEFDLILIDIGLPDIPGDQLVEWFKGRLIDGEKTPLFVALTAHIDSSKVSHYLNSGFDHLLQKPLAY